MWRNRNQVYPSSYLKTNIYVCIHRHTHTHIKQCTQEIEHIKHDETQYPVWGPGTEQWKNW